MDKGKGSGELFVKNMLILQHHFAMLQEECVGGQHCQGQAQGQGQTFQGQGERQ